MGGVHEKGRRSAEGGVQEVRCRRSRAGGGVTDDEGPDEAKEGVKGGEG